MADFKSAFQRLLPVEGGYVNNPRDNGGETYKGISRKFWPQWEGWKIIDALKREPGFPGNLANHQDLKELIAKFYYENFWLRINGDKIIVQEIADELFDTAVNMGVNVSIEFVQTALNLLNRNQKNYKDIAIDGILGKETIKLLNEFVEVEILLRAINALQASRYIKICELHPDQEEFFRGWLKRAS